MEIPLQSKILVMRISLTSGYLILLTEALLVLQFQHEHTTLLHDAVVSSTPEDYIIPKFCTLQCAMLSHTSERGLNTILCRLLPVHRYNSNYTATPAIYQGHLLRFDILNEKSVTVLLLPSMQLSTKESIPLSVGAHCNIPAVKAFVSP